MRRFSGVVPALAVPFRGCEVDFDMLSEHVERLLRAGVDGFFVVSTTGLGHAMGIRSKVELVRFVTERRGSAFVIVNVSSIEFEEIRELVRASERFGADAVSSNVMYYFRVDEEAALRFFVKVSSLTELPFFVYNIPQTTGYNVDPGLVRRLRSEAENLAGVKDSSANIPQIADLATIEGLRVFNGADETTLPALLAGASGYVSALANAFPELFVGLYRAYREGDLGRAVDLYRRVLGLSADLRGVPLNHAVYGLLTAVYGREFPLMEHFRSLRREEVERVSRALERYRRGVLQSG